MSGTRKKAANGNELEYRTLMLAAREERARYLFVLFKEYRAAVGRFLTRELFGDRATGPESQSSTLNSLSG